MKNINIFTIDVIKDFPYSYDIIIQVLVKERQKEKNLYFESV
jgi:late competence protein required for DNA uptake (superfamily II DNA/RNA helicase)